MLKTGKLDSRLLEDIVFRSIKFKRDEVLTRPGIGEDCAVVDFGEHLCVMSTDPISAAVSQIGRLAVHISCNDIASNGVEPLGVMLAVMLPVGTKEEAVSEMMSQAGETAAALGVEIIGGHTEITPAVNRPVIVSTAIGRGSASAVKPEVRPGDMIFVTKSAGLEGSGIVACDLEDELRGKLTQAEIDEAKSYMDMVSVVKEGVAAGKAGFSAMHDVTEGGVLGAVWELCRASGVGAEVRQDSVPVTDVTRKICSLYGMDPLRLISSGCMLIITPQDKKEPLEKGLRERGVRHSLIGVVKEPSYGVKMVCCGQAVEVSPPESDELYKAVKG